MLWFFNTFVYFPFLNLLVFFTWLVPGHNAFWGVLLLTIVVRLILLVPSQRATEAQRKITKLQPLLNELKTEYGDDRQGLAVAQMDLYKKNGINPFASCGLNLIQLPILLILYRVILHGLQPGGTAGLYGWVPRPEEIQTVFLWVDLIKPDRTYIIPILAAVFQFIQVKMMMPAKPTGTVAEDPAMAMQRNMLYIFPAMTLLVAGSLPSGAAVYWVVSTLFTIGQQYVVNREKLRLVGVKEAQEEGEKVQAERNRPKQLQSGSNVPGRKTSTVQSPQSATPAPEPKVEKKGGVTVTVRRKKTS